MSTIVHLYTLDSIILIKKSYSILLCLPIVPFAFNSYIEMKLCALSKRTTENRLYACFERMIVNSKIFPIPICRDRVQHSQIDTLLAWVFLQDWTSLSDHKSTVFDKKKKV